MDKINLVKKWWYHAPNDYWTCRGHTVMIDRKIRINAAVNVPEIYKAVEDLMTIKKSISLI